MEKNDKIVEEAVLSSKKRVSFLGVNIDPLTLSQTVNLVRTYIIDKIPLHLIGVNADKINICHKDVEMLRLVNSCGLINADGASVVLGSKIMGLSIPERVAGIDLMQSLIAMCAQENYSVYFLGAKQDVVTKTVKEFQKRFPTLRIAGSHDGYFEKKEWSGIASLLIKEKPDIVFIGITSPTKEYLAEFLQGQGVDSVLMGVGGSFDVFSGKIKRAPLWMQKSNLEWLFRVMMEPKRLFKRYLFGNVTFGFKVFKAVLFSDRKN